MSNLKLALSRSQILGFRRQVGSLDERLPKKAESLRRAAWAGLQDSMPRAALLSIHARVREATPTVWRHPSLIQVWGPRYSVFVVPEKDLAIFTRGRLPEDSRGRTRAETAATRLHAFLKGRRMPFNEAGHGMGVHPNSLRYGTTTGRILIRWEGAGDSVVWTGPEPDMEPQSARIELARRHLHVFGPTTATSFANWAGVRPAEANSAFGALKGSLMAVRTPIGDACILAEDEAAFRSPPRPAATARLLPSGDAYYLFWGTDRDLLVSDARHRATLWTSRVWPGALLVDGEIVGVWRRSAGEVSIESWRRLSASEKEAIEAEAASLPLPGLNGPITVHWS